MKDLNISVKDQIRELWYLLIAFMISNALNIGAIIYYHSPAIEIVTSIFYVICFSIFLYFLPYNQNHYIKMLFLIT